MSKSLDPKLTSHSEYQLPEMLRKIFGLAILMLLGSVLLGLPGCGGSPLILSQPGQPTLVFIYTDG